MPMSKKHVTTFAARLRALRAEAGLSVAALASKSGVNRTYIHNLEDGRRVDPRLSLLVKLADALGVSLEAFRAESVSREDEE